MSLPVDEVSIERIFSGARTHNRWSDRPVEPALLERAYALAALGPTSMNCQPARFVFLVGPESKARLLPALPAMNVEKTRTAPVTAIIATDSKFFIKLPMVFPHAPTAQDMFVADPALAQTTAFRNGSLTGAYFMLALRALGLDCGAMSGFGVDQVNAEFFPDGRWRANFLLNIGYGDGSALFPRQPRIPLSEACVFLP